MYIYIYTHTYIHRQTNTHAYIYVYMDIDTDIDWKSVGMFKTSLEIRKFSYIWVGRVLVQDLGSGLVQNLVSGSRMWSRGLQE